jgi:hypothetical protein
MHTCDNFLAHSLGFGVLGSLDFGAPRWIIHNKEDKIVLTRWILGIFSANSLDFDYF